MFTYLNALDLESSCNLVYVEVLLFFIVHPTKHLFGSLSFVKNFRGGERFKGNLSLEHLTRRCGVCGRYLKKKITKSKVLKQNKFIKQILEVEE